MVFIAIIFLYALSWPGCLKLVLITPLNTPNVPLICQSDCSLIVPAWMV